MMLILNYSIAPVVLEFVWIEYWRAMGFEGIGRALFEGEEV
jgi:hypothetical protein